jgi:hypothetical protein
LRKEGARWIKREVKGGGIKRKRKDKRRFASLYLFAVCINPTRCKITRPKNRTREVKESDLRSQISESRTQKSDLITQTTESRDRNRDTRTQSQKRRVDERREIKV